MRFLLLLSTLLLSLATTPAVEIFTAPCGGHNVTVCRVNLKQDNLQLYLNDDTGRPFHNFDRLAAWLRTQGRTLTWGMNAGMYHADYSAVGLFIAEGRQSYPLNTGDAPGNFFLKPNGVFLVTAAGQARVVETSQVPKIKEPLRLATQSGPLLVLQGRIHPKFKQGSEHRLVRNGVGVPSPGVALFAITEGPVNLYDFAAFFRDTLKCPNALFLDGTVSSLYSPAHQRNDRKIPLGPLVGVTTSTP